MNFYRLECTTEDGLIECNGYFLKKENAEAYKKELDESPYNMKYNIKQHIVECEMSD